MSASSKDNQFTILPQNVKYLYILSIEKITGARVVTESYSNPDKGKSRVQSKHFRKINKNIENPTLGFQKTVLYYRNLSQEY